MTNETTEFCVSVVFEKLVEVGMHIMKPITQRQREYLAAIIDITVAQGFPPTWDEIHDFLGLGRNKGSMPCVRALEDKGYLYIQPYTNRGLLVLKDPDGIPIKWGYTYG